MYHNGIVCALKIRRAAYSWLCQFLDHLDFRVRDDVDVADNVGAIPLILLFDGWQQKPGVAIVVIVSAEQPTFSTGGLIQRKKSKAPRSSSQCIFSKQDHFSVSSLCLTILMPSPRQSISYFFLSGISWKDSFFFWGFFFSVVSRSSRFVSFGGSSCSAFFCFSSWNSKYFRLPLARWCSGSV